MTEEQLASDFFMLFFVHAQNEVEAEIQASEPELFAKCMEENEQQHFGDANTQFMSTLHERITNRFDALSDDERVALRKQLFAANARAAGLLHVEDTTEKQVDNKNHDDEKPKIDDE